MCCLDWLLVIFGYFIFLNYFKHYLMILMCLEYLVLLVLYSMFMNLNLLDSEIFYMIIMVFFVIESVLGLSILVCLVHFKGNDHVKNLNLLMW